MTRGRWLALASLLALGAGAAQLISWAGGIYHALALSAERPEADALALTPRLRGIWTGRSYAWLWHADHAPARTPYLLIDTGSDPACRALLTALAREGLGPEAVGHVLLTHGHADHTAGLDCFEHAQVWASPADGALARGDRGPNNLWMRWRTRALQLPKRARSQHPLVAGQRLTLWGETLGVVALPGHTPGSLAFELGGGLFAGDAVWAPSLGAEALSPYPATLAESPAQITPVLSRLKTPAPTYYRFVADGHCGLMLNAWPVPPQ